MLLFPDRDAAGQTARGGPAPRRPPVGRTDDARKRPAPPASFGLARRPRRPGHRTTLPRPSRPPRLAGHQIAPRPPGVKDGGAEVQGYHRGLEPVAPPDLSARLEASLGAVGRRLEAARRRSPRAAPAVRLLVVTKTIPAAWLDPLGRAGAMDVGENRVTGAPARRRAGPAALRWHLIGHLQRNKADLALDAFDEFHALDSLRLAAHLAGRLAARARAPWPVYVQVNASGEPQKGGLGPSETIAVLREVLAMPALLPVGFMTLARHGAPDAELRRTFRTLVDLRAEARRLGLGDPPPAELSMGMSDDFEVAVEEGATIVRVGRAVFEGVAPLGPPPPGGAR